MKGKGAASHDALLAQLADGSFHSGEALASRLGISRTAVWKRVQRLQVQLGIEVHAVRGRGYRLAFPLELLDASLIHAALSQRGRDRLDGLVLHTTIGSTNSEAGASPSPPTGRAKVWIAEHQSAGRGRRGRPWVSVFGSNLYLSLAWRFDRALSELPGLSLVAGVVVAETLTELGAQGLVLKWPNDVVAHGKKICGILVEASGETAGPATAVIGIGLNLCMPRSVGTQIDQPWTDLDRLGISRVSRNGLAARLIDGLIAACEQFEHAQLHGFLPRWHAFDALHDRSIRIMHGERATEGVYRGITPNGAVRIETDGGIEEHLAGEVSLRPVAP